MEQDDLARHLFERVLDACTLYGRRQISEEVLRLSLTENAASLRALGEPDAARVLRSLAEVVEAVVRERPEGKRYVEVCSVCDRVRAVARARFDPDLTLNAS